LVFFAFLSLALLMVRTLRMGESGEFDSFQIWLLGFVYEFANLPTN
jgi:hypothetical protein